MKRPLTLSLCGLRQAAVTFAIAMLLVGCSEGVAEDPAPAVDDECTDCLSVDKTEYAPGESVLVQWRTPDASEDAWLCYYEQGQANDTRRPGPLGSLATGCGYTNGGSLQGSFSFPAPLTPGNYDLRLFLDEQLGPDARSGTTGYANAAFAVRASATCGNAACDGGEDAATCPGDCPPVNGDGLCSHDENAGAEPGDCPAVNGDGLCTEGETANTAPDDCPAVSGDGLCTHEETCVTNPGDCGTCEGECAPVSHCITFGATWRYDDSDTDHGLAWTEASFDDSSWLSGPGEFGFGDDDEATLLRNNGPSYYFRRSFFIARRPDLASVSVAFDDGIAVFLNGAEVYRDSINNGLAHVEYAGSGGGTDIDEFRLGPTSFAVGENTIAVVIKNGKPESTDVSFDLSLILGQ